MEKWFKNVESIEELRKQYRELLKKHHPDNGGNVSDMQSINIEYDRLFADLSHKNKSDRQHSAYDDKAENEAFKKVIDSIIHINTEIEIIGAWVWIHGGYEYRELLKSIGFRYAPKKKCWCWHYGEYRRHHKTEISLADIRIRYGSQKVRNHTEQRRVETYV